MVFFVVPPSRLELSEALIIGGYAFYQEHSSIDRISQKLRGPKSLWTGTRNKKSMKYKHCSAFFVARSMYEMAGLTERTWSHVERHQIFLRKLFKKKSSKVRFWKAILPSTIKLSHSELNLGT